MIATRQIGDRIPGRIASVMDVQIEERDGRPFVIYLLSDSLRGPPLRAVSSKKRRAKLRLIAGRTR